MVQVGSWREGARPADEGPRVTSNPNKELKHSLLCYVQEDSKSQSQALDRTLDSIKQYIGQNHWTQNMNKDSRFEEVVNRLRAAYQPVSQSYRLYSKLDFDTDDKRDKTNCTKLLKIYTESLTDFKKDSTKLMADLCLDHGNKIKNARETLRGRDSSPVRKPRKKDLSD